MIRHSISHRLGLCSCGRGHGGAHAAGPGTPDAAIAQGVEQALLHGLFPSARTRRQVLAAVGAGAVLDALTSLLPLEASSRRWR